MKVNGTVYTGSCGYSSGTTLTLQAVPLGQYKFKQWGGALTGSANPTTLTMNTSKSVTAYFDVKTESVNLQGAKSLLDGGGDVLVLDVSTAAEYAAGHLLCAKNYVWSGANFSSDITNLNPYKDDDILIYDQTGAKSAAAANYLAGQGFNSVYYLADAFNPDWIAEYESFTTAEDGDVCSSLAPLAYAGADQSVNENAAVTLRGQGWAPDGRAVTYAWTQAQGSNTVTLSNAAAAQPVFTAPNLNGSDDILVFHLTVTDSGGKKDTDDVMVHVNWANAPPTAYAGPDQTVTPGTLVTLDGSGSTDPENSIVSYQWIVDGGSLNPTLANASTASPSFTASATGWVFFRLTVTDNGALTSTDTVKVTVSDGSNTPPTAHAGGIQTVTEGATVTLDSSGSSDSDGTIASREWTQTSGPSVTLSPNKFAVKPTFIAPEVTATTNLTFSLTVTDDDDATGTDTVVITITDNNPGPDPNDKDKDGYTPAQGDCNDNDAAIHPGAAEICGDNKDNNCDGNTDEGCSDPWSGNYAVQIQSKLSVKKWGKASTTVNGLLTLQDNGTFLIDNYSTPYDMSGIFELDAKGKKILYSLNGAGLVALEDYLIVWLEATAAAEGLDLSDLDYKFLKIKTSKVKIDKNTQRATGKMTFTVSGTVSGCIAGEGCGEMKFNYKATILIN